ncbi:hypothetical protein TNCV_318281 [Trichonephila clavipes]|nr:hypothetical protein TNCV_318281 [Trichonephila clavipes]
MKRLDQCLKDLMKHMRYSEFGSSLRSIENFPADRYIIKQRQKEKFQTFKQAEASQCYDISSSATMQTLIDILCFARNTAKRNFIQGKWRPVQQA